MTSLRLIMGPLRGPSGSPFGRLRRGWAARSVSACAAGAPCGGTPERALGQGLHSRTDLDLEVVAEGVENAGMARQLLSLGCDYGQGFGYAPALSPQEAEVYLNESYLDGAA